jgi:hypothetical protein
MTQDRGLTSIGAPVKASAGPKLEQIMRWLITTLLLVTGAVSNSAPAQSPGPFVRVVALHAVLLASDSNSNEVQNFTLQCPAGYIPTAYSITPAHDDDDFFAEVGRQLIDSNKTALDRSALTSTAQLDGGGYVVSLITVGEAHHSSWNLEISLPCVSALVTTDDTLTLVKTTGTAAARSLTTRTTFCPSDFPVALGGFSNADGIWLEPSSAAPVWGTPANPVSLDETVDGQTGPPNGWQARVFNHFNAPVLFVGYGLCGKAPALQTFVYSAPTVPETAFSIFGAVPDGWTAVGSGFDGGLYGLDKGLDAWMQDGTVVNLQAWHSATKSYDSGSASLRAYIAKGIDSRLNSGGDSKAPARAVLAVLAVPQAATQPPPTSVNVVEFYNATLDHYFITAIPKEISDLDNGVHVGWVRTGETFKAYGIGSSGRTGRRPVCRAYGRPEAGLNSHFYSASPDECFATLANFNGAWGLEASEVFEMDLPDPMSGVCPADSVPIYRTWNRRLDSNHRYTTRIAIRDQMVAKGHVAEGYGPNAVALCGLS